MPRSTRIRLPGADVARPFRRVARAAALSLAAAGIVAPTASAAAPGPEFFGTNFSTLSAIKPEGQPLMLDSLSRSRMTINRIDVRWNLVEPTQVSTSGGRAGYVWDYRSGTDALIGAMASRGLRASPSFRFPPSWAGGGIGNRVLPAHYEDFGRMILAYARRYGVDGSFWTENPSLPKRPVLTYELWNEVNLDEYAWSTNGDGDGDADAAAYAAMAKVVRGIVKPALPSAILLGSLSWKDRLEEVADGGIEPLYVPKLAASGGLAALDGMGFHPYAPDAQATLDLIVKLRRQLSEAGAPAMPIYADEAGQEAVTVDPSTGQVSPTNRTPARWAHELFPSDAARGANLAFSGEALAASNCGVAQFLPYGASGPFAAIYDPDGKNGLPRTENWMGLWFPSGQPTLSAQALQRASVRWASRFDAGGPGAPAPLTLCGGGASPDASKLTIDSVFTGLDRGCAKVVTSYDGNPLESAYLRFFDPVTGAQVAEARTDAFGAAQQCVPDELKGRPFRILADIGQAGTTGVVECDVSGVGCQPGVELRPGRSTLSASAVAGVAPAPPGSAPPKPAPRPCTWELRMVQGKFTRDRKGTRGRQRFTAAVTCSTAPAGAKVRFLALKQVKKGKKGKREIKVQTIWITVGKPRVVGIPGVRRGERVVLLHREEPTIGIPRLRASLPVAAKPVK